MLGTPNLHCLWNAQLAEKGIQMANKLLKRNVSLLANQSNWEEMGVQGITNNASGVVKKWKFTCDEIGILKKCHNILET